MNRADGGADLEGQGTLLAGLALLGKLHRAGPAEAEPRTREADAPSLRRRRTEPADLRRCRCCSWSWRREPNNASYYAALAEYAYKAKNTRVGDLATEKAVKLAPAADRTRVKAELESVKKSPNGQVLTTTTNGTTYTGKANGEGGFEGTAVKTTPKPTTSTGATSTSGKTK